MITYESSRARGRKVRAQSFDATMRSNLSIAPPIDLLCYPEGSLRADVRVDIAEDDPYFSELRVGYERGILELLKRLPKPDWIEAADPAID